MKRLISGILMALSVMVLVGCGSSTPAAQAPVAPAVQGPAVQAPAAAPLNMSVVDLKQKLDANEKLFLLDVRTPEEFTGDGHVSQATLIPLDQLGQRLNELPKDQPIACICRSGNRSVTACNLLRQQGFTLATNVEGGMRAWAGAGYPVAR